MAGLRSSHTVTFPSLTNGGNQKTCLSNVVGHSPATRLQTGVVLCAGDGPRPHGAKHCNHDKKNSLIEWMGCSGNIVHDYIVADAGTNMLAQVKAAGLKGIICLVCMLHLVVKDTLELGSIVTWEMQVLLETIEHLATHFSSSLPVCCVRDGEGEESEQQLIQV